MKTNWPATILNKAGPAESGVIAIVPKRTSTSAAVDVYQIPAGTTRPDQITASYCLSVEKNGKNVAKFKQTDNVHTTTCTAAILGYYHLARALGETMAVTMVIGNSPQAKWSLFAPQYTMSAVIANEFTEATTDIYLGALFEIGLVLFGVTIVVNLIAQVLLKTMTTSTSATRAVQ